MAESRASLTVVLNFETGPHGSMGPHYTLEPQMHAATCKVLQDWLVTYGGQVCPSFSKGTDFMVGNAGSDYVNRCILVKRR